MSFFRDSTGIYQSEALAELPWLAHGFGTRLGTPHPTPFTVKQIHSDIVLLASAAAGCEGDALITANPGEAIGIKTADCVPIILADPQHRAIGVAHAGWRGTLGNITQRVLDKMGFEYRTDPGAVIAAIGPAIGPCCYEVGPEVGKKFQPLFPERAGWERATKIDLWESNRRHLISGGVVASRIAVAGLCTFCLAGEFHSWRREGPSAGRMISFAGILP